MKLVYTLYNECMFFPQKPFHQFLTALLTKMKKMAAEDERGAKMEADTKKTT